MTDILDSYVKTAPTAQAAIDIFKGEWSSILPDELGATSGGGAGLFGDARISWFLSKLDTPVGKHFVELGPLEGGHSYMLERAGAASVTAVESNTRAYLKCLIVKELLNLQRCRFLLGDCVEFLKSDRSAFDVGLASGVIYHMRNPAELIQLLSARCRELLVWTHYYDAEQIRTRPALERVFGRPERTEHAGFRHTLVKRTYGEALGWQGFCGGSADYTCWMPREDLLACFDHFGMDVTAIEFDHPDHPNGPALALHARARQST